MKSIFLKSIFLPLLFLLVFSSLPLTSEALNSICEINVSVNGTSINVSAKVREGSPGIDPSQVSLYMYDTASAVSITASANQDSISRSYEAHNIPPGDHQAWVEGVTTSNPGAFISSCSNVYYFTIIDDPVYGCTDPTAQNYDPNATHNDGSCIPYPPPPPPPGPFNVTTSYCFGWPNPRIEVNLNPSSGADYYALQKWNGSSYQTIYTGSYQGVDSYEDTNIAMYNTYWYRAVAYNNYGSTVSNNEISHYPTPADCGQVLRSLSVSIGTPSGSVVGTGGISCLSACDGSYESGASVNLIAYPSSGYAFSHWTGACATQGASCGLTMNSNLSTSAHFILNTYTLSVSVSGSGSVSSSPAGINSCTSNCSYTYNYGTNVSLTPSPSAGQSFTGWSGACSGTTVPCTVSMTAARSVGATFATNTYTLSATSPTGGTITGSGISCPGDCSETFSYGTSVTLYANPSANYSFSGWTGDCSGTGSCTLTMNSAKSVGATFAAVPFNYSLSNQGTVNITKASGNVYGQNVITKTLLAGATQSVDLVSVSGVPSGISYSIANKVCSPTCSSTITFTVPPTAPVGTYPVTVTGSPLSKTTNFNLVIAGAPFGVSCSVNPGTSAVLGQNVTWSATTDGGVPPLTYRWSGSGIPTSPAPSTNPYTLSYSTIGTKTATLTVTDSESVQSTCPPASIEITFDPNFEEF